MFNVVISLNNQTSFNSFVKKNISNINVILVDIDTFIGELHRCNIVANGYESFHAIVASLKSLFGDDFYKKKMPLASPYVMSSMYKHFSDQIDDKSFLYLAYMYSIPVVLIDSYHLNSLMSGQFTSSLVEDTYTTMANIYEYLYEDSVGQNDIRVFKYEDSPSAPSYKYTILSSMFTIPNMVIGKDFNVPDIHRKYSYFYDGYKWI